MKQVLRIFFVLSITALMAGCKLAVIVVEGGEVSSSGWRGTCLAGNICFVEVDDPNFSQTFTAVSSPGWHFVKWNKGGHMFCGDSTEPTCTLSLEGTAQIEAIGNILASDNTFYLMPIFSRSEPDSIMVDGREWAQVDLFTNLTWDQINAVCPEGVCAGILNGFDMTGWTWASLDDVNALFNYYIGSENLGPGPDCYPEELFLWGPYPEWAANYHNDGMRVLFTEERSGTRIGQSTVGYVSEYRFGSANFTELFSSAGTIARICTNDEGAERPQDEADIVGGWFYR